MKNGESFANQFETTKSFSLGETKGAETRTSVLNVFKISL